MVTIQTIWEANNYWQFKYWNVSPLWITLVHSILPCKCILQHRYIFDWDHCNDKDNPEQWKKHWNLKKLKLKKRYNENDNDISINNYNWSSFTYIKHYYLKAPEPRFSYDLTMSLNLSKPTCNQNKQIKVESLRLSLNLKKQKYYSGNPYSTGHSNYRNIGKADS